jgi:CRISPR/Cas system-associated endonuclease/helicase Cas3
MQAYWAPAGSGKSTIFPIDVARGIAFKDKRKTRVILVVPNDAVANDCRLRLQKRCNDNNLSFVSASTHAGAAGKLNNADVALLTPWYFV